MKDIASLAGDILKDYQTSVAFNLDNVSKIGQRIGLYMAGRITGGEATPILAKSTIMQKRRKGYTQPETPLYAKGDYASKFEGLYISPEEMQIVNTDYKSPQWKALKQRTLSIINADTVNAILEEEVFNAINND
jgi:hypothetical protein